MHTTACIVSFRIVKMCRENKAGIISFFLSWSPLLNGQPTNLKLVCANSALVGLYNGNIYVTVVLLRRRKSVL